MSEQLRAALQMARSIALSGERWSEQAEATYRAALAAAPSTPTPPCCSFEPEIEQPNEAQDRLYNAGYAAGQRAITDAMLAWLDDGPDQGDNEFMWKSAVRSQLHEQEQKEEGHDGQDMDRHEASLPHRLPRL